MSDESVHWRSTGKKTNTHFFCLHNSSSTDSLFYEIQYTTFDKLSEALLLLCFDTSCNSSLSRCFNLIGRAGLGWVDKRSQCFVRQHRLKVMCCHCWVFNWKHKSKIREGGGAYHKGLSELMLAASDVTTPPFKIDRAATLVFLRNCAQATTCDTKQL